MSAPIFVVVEGLDGTGKSTLAAQLASALDAPLLRTPPEELACVRATADGVYAHADIATQLFYASTVAYVSDQVRQLRAARRSVVVDRYWLSTVVYAACREECAALDDVASHLQVPDVTVYLETSEPLRRARVHARGCTVADRASFRDGEQLRARYDAALHGPIAGRVLRVHTGDRTSSEVLADVLAELGRVA